MHVKRADRPKVIIIGGSAGSLSVVSSILAALSVTYPIPIVIVMHRPDVDDSRLIEVLQRQCNLVVREAQHGETLEPRCAYIAPADHHLTIDNGRFGLNKERKVRFTRPSIDVSFESVALSFGGSALGILLTGGNRDGADGMLHLKKVGAQRIVQSPETAEAPLMPSWAIKVGASDVVMSPNELIEHMKGYEF
jgi:two-component system chemotaxis response regulator CheB